VLSSAEEEGLKAAEAWGPRKAFAPSKARNRRAAPEIFMVK
jgi:hypothetical protein